MRPRGGESLLTRRDFLTLGTAVVASAVTGLGAASLLPLPRAGASAPTPLPVPAPTPSPAAAAPSPAAAAPMAAVPPAKPVTVALLSDPHTQATYSDVARLVNPKLVKALTDLQPLTPDLWLVNGDLAEDGVQAQYAAFKEITGKVVPPGKLLVTTGNHDFYDFKVSDADSLRRFREMFGLPQVYSSRVVSGVHLVTLADEARKNAPDSGHPDWAWLSPEQLHWFEQVLAENRQRFTAVFLHQPLQNTVAASVGANPMGGSGQAKELRAILAKNPQAKLWFSGHTHRRIDADGQVVHDGGTAFVALGSTAYLAGAGGGKDYSASQSRVLEIYPDRVVVRARDHTAGQWLDHLQVTLPLV